MINSLAFLLLLLLAEAASSRFSRVVEAVATTPAHVSGGAGAAAEGAATAAGSEIAAAQQPPPVFDVDDALAAIRAQAAAGGLGHNVGVFVVGRLPFLACRLRGSYDATHSRVRNDARKRTC